MQYFEIGDTCLCYCGDYPMISDLFMEKFRIPAPGKKQRDTINIESHFFDMNQFARAQILHQSGLGWLCRTNYGDALLFPWAKCRFAYGFPLAELHNGDVLRCWFNPDIQSQIPLNFSRFFSTVGLHSKLLQCEAPVLHAAYIDYQGQAILFTAPAQTGKSTQAELWREYAGAEIINGDRVLLRRREKRWHAFGYPCCGSSDICINRTLPLRAIVVLEQGAENQIVSMKPSEKIRAIFTGIERYLWDQREMDMALTLAHELAAETEIVRLVCRPDTQAVDVLRNYLSGGGI